MKASGLDIKVEEVAIEHGAPRSVRLDWFDSYKDPHRWKPSAFVLHFARM
jgi:hypothetical protein